MSQQKQETQSQQQTSPWAPQAAALTGAFGDANNAYAKAAAVQAPTDFTATMTPDQLALYQSMTSAGNGGISAANTGVNTGASNVTAGSTGAQSALTGLGAFDPTANNNASSVMNTAQSYVNSQNIPAQVQNAMQSAEETARDVTNPMTENAAAGNGNTNSSRTGLAEGIVDRGLAEQAGNLYGTLSNQAYNTGTNLGENMATNNNSQTLSALTGALSGGTGLTTAGSGQVSSGVNDLANSYGLNLTGASGAQQNQQLALQNALQQYQMGTQAPFTPINNLMQIIGSNNWGSNSSGTSTTTTTPSALQIIGGGMNSLGSLIGSGGGALTGGSGILGLMKAFGGAGAGTSA